MINLLPPATQKKFTRRYYLRFFSFLFFGLALAVLIGAGLLVPSYFLARSEAVSAERYARAVEETVGLKEQSGATQETAMLAEQVKILSSFENVPVTAHALSEIERALPKNISLEAIRIQHGDSGEGTITVIGVSGSRADLLRFSEALKGNSFFNGVSVPVGQLVNETNVPFSFSFRFAIATP